MLLRYRTYGTELSLPASNADINLEVLLDVLQTRYVLEKAGRSGGVHCDNLISSGLNRCKREVDTGC